MELTIRYVITLLLFIFPIALSLENNGFRVELSHVDSKGNFTKTELLYRAAARTMHRVSRFKGRQLFSSENISSTVYKNSEQGAYYMDLAIGTPPLYYSAIVDTGSDLIWTQCTPCQNCVSQPTPIYNPSNSTTVSSIPCNSTLYQDLCSVVYPPPSYPPPSCLCSYNYPYGKGWTSGTLKNETFTFGTTKSVQLPNTVFGCSTSTSDALNGTAGLVGFGRGKFSLPSQLNASMFSYCLTSFLDTNSTSTLFLGPVAKFSETAVKSTPFVKNPMSSYYYLSLQGISLGTTKLSIQSSAFTLQPNGTGGFIIDSGTTITYLINQAYQAVQNAIDSIVNQPRVDGLNITGLDTCYNLPSGSSPPTMPDMIFHFEGADMVLPVENYMMLDQENNLWCLALLGTDSLSTISVSIFGNYQQQNFHIMYDVDNEVLSFAPAQCDNL